MFSGILQRLKRAWESVVVVNFNETSHIKATYDYSYTFTIVDRFYVCYRSHPVNSVRPRMLFSKIRPWEVKQYLLIVSSNYPGFIPKESFLAIRIMKMVIMMTVNILTTSSRYDFTEFRA